MQGNGQWLYLSVQHHYQILWFYDLANDFAWLPHRGRSHGVNTHCCSYIGFATQLSRIHILLDVHTRHNGRGPWHVRRVTWHLKHAEYTSVLPVHCHGPTVCSILRVNTLTDVLEDHRNRLTDRSLHAINNRSTLCRGHELGRVGYRLTVAFLT